MVVDPDRFRREGKSFVEDILKERLDELNSRQKHRKETESGGFQEAQTYRQMESHKAELQRRATSEKEPALKTYYERIAKAAGEALRATKFYKEYIQPEAELERRITDLERAQRAL